MQFFKNIVFWKKLVLIGIIPLLIMSVLIGTLSYDRARQAAESSGKRSLADAVNRLDISMTVRTRQLDNAVQTMAGSLALQQLAAEEAEPYGTAELIRLCSEIVNPFQEVQSVSLVDETGLLASSEEAVTLNQAVVSELYSQVLRYPGKAVWTDLSQSIFWEHREAGAAYILIARGIQNETGETIGMLVVELDAYTTGSTLLAKQNILPSQVSFLLDSEQQMICRNNMIEDELIRKIMHEYSTGKRAFWLEEDGRQYYCCAQYNGLVGWVTVSIAAQEDLFAQGDSLRSYIVLVVVSCLIIACILLMVLSQMVTKPLEQLNAGMKQVQERNFKVHLRNDRKDELGELTDRFNYMVDEINTLINRVYRELLAQKNAELEALQAQINPHFLYNTLDSINWMLIDRGEMDVSEIIVALGKLMQYSMDTQVSMVPLLEEYNNARDYLLIQKNRLEDQLEYQLELAEELEDIRVPKLILQPLIENAIKHGLLPAGRQGLVRVETVRRGARIRITVQDDGIGMDEEGLNRYRQLLNGADNQRSIGVRNVARRLQLRFGDVCRLEVESSPGQGTAVTVILPVDLKEETDEDRNY